MENIPLFDSNISSTYKKVTIRKKIIGRVKEKQNTITYLELCTR